MFSCEFWRNLVAAFGFCKFILFHKCVRYVSKKTGDVEKTFMKNCHFCKFIITTVRCVKVENRSSQPWSGLELKVYRCKYENPTIRWSSNKRKYYAIAHCDVFHFLRYANVRYDVGLFTNIQKQQNILKIDLLFNKNTNFTGK